MIAELPHWRDSKAAFLGRVAATTGTLKIVLKTKDDHYLLERWIAHHARIVGLDNLVIFDNMSTDARVHDIYRQYQSRVPIVRFDGYYNAIHSSQSFPGLYSCLKDTCEFFVFLDTDEFLIQIEGDTYTSDARVLEFLHRGQRCDVFPGTWLENARGSDSRFAAGTSLVSFAGGLAWGKPIVRSSAYALGRPDLVTHNVEIDKALYAGEILTNCFILHLKHLDAQQRIDVNITKLIARDIISPDETLASVLRRDPEAIGDPVARRLVHELRELATTSGEKAARSDGADDGWLELGPAGTVRYSSEAQANAMRTFLTRSQRFCTTVLHSDSKDVRTHAVAHWRRWQETFGAPDDHPLTEPCATTAFLSPNATPHIVNRTGEPALNVRDIVNHALERELEEERRSRERFEAFALFKHRLRDLIDRTIPPGGTVLVVSRSDDTLLQSNRQRVWHFPRTPDGRWNGHPANSEDAIDQLEAIRASGRTFLVLPAASFWWLEYYDGLSRYLREQYRTVVHDEQTAVVFESTAPDSRKQ